MESDGLHKQWKRIGIGLLIMLLVILGGILWWQFQSPEQADISILKIMPYFEMEKPDGETYFLGGGGQWGPYPRNTPWHELLIEGRVE